MPSPKWWQKIFSIIGSIASAGKSLFSITALLVVMAWGASEVFGYHPDDTWDKILAGGIIVLMVFEIFKTTTTHQINKQAFMLDLITGGLEFTIFCVVITVLLIFGDHSFEYRMMTYAMGIFVACDAYFVPYNRFVMVFRQITSISDTGDDHHRHAQVAATTSSHL